MLNLEKKYYSKKVKFIAGTDEAGRGCLLGPVVAAAVIFPKDFLDERINDSKQLSENKRNELYKLIIDNALSYSITIVPPEKIDEINILEASRFAMEECLRRLDHDYDFVLTDAMKLYHCEKPFEAIIKGDTKAQCIAAASILAKVTRDNICYELDKQFPQFNIGKNKGYGTKDHLLALDEYGPIKGLHRFSYKPVKQRIYKQISLF